MAQQLNRLEIEFGTEQKPIILIQERINAVTQAIGTKALTHQYNITQDEYGHNLLSGWIAPPDGASINETDHYVLTANGVKVKADTGSIQSNSYTLNCGSMQTLREGGSIQLYCISSKDGTNVTMTSMTVWVYLHFGSSPTLSGVDKQDVMSCLNCEDWKCVNTTGDVWRGRLVNRYGIVESVVLGQKVGQSPKNAGWSIMTSFRAYPSLLDDNPNTTDEDRIHRLTPGLAGTDGIEFGGQSADSAPSVTFHAEPVKGVEIVSSNNVPTAGNIVRFTAASLLPADNTKVKYIPLSECTISWELQESGIGSVNGGEYNVATGIEKFTIIARLNYMGSAIQTTKEYKVSTAVLSSTGDNTEMFEAVREALMGWQYPNWDPINAVAITNIQAENVPESYIKDIMINAFARGAKNFEALQSFKLIKELYLPEGENTTLQYIMSPNITTIYGPGSLSGLLHIHNTDFPNVTTINAGNMLKNNTNITAVDMPALQSIDINAEGGSDAHCFDGCSNLTSLNLPNIKRIRARDCFLFRNCSNLQTVDLSSVDDFQCTRSNGMWQGCAKLGMNNATVNLFQFNSLTIPGDNYIFDGCAQLRSYDVSNVDIIQTSASEDTAGNNYMFRNCTSLQYVKISPQLTIFRADGDLGMFDGCAALKGVYTGNSASNGANLANIQQIQTKNNYLFRGCTVLPSITLPQTVQAWLISSADAMFEGCSDLSSIIMPAGATTIGNTTTAGDVSTFKGCGKLSNISWPSLRTVNCMKNNMFQGCGSLTNAGLDLSGLEDINGNDINEMFMGCMVLTNLKLPGLKSIKYGYQNSMFKNCSNLVSISFPQLTTINNNNRHYRTDDEGNRIVLDDKMFEGCTTLGNGFTATDTDLYAIYMPNLTSWYAGVNKTFAGLENPNTINLEKLSIISSYEGHMFEGYQGTISLPKLEQVSSSTNDYTFSTSTITTFNCPELSILRASGGVLGTFKDCTSLRTVNIPKITTMTASTDNELFSGCSSITLLNFGRASENTSGLTISGNNLTNMLKGLSTAQTGVIRTTIEGSEYDNVITSRISSLSGEFLYDRTFIQPVGFPKLTNVSNAFVNITTDRISIGIPQ